MIKYTFLCICFCFLFTACNNDDDSPSNQAEEEANFYGLKIGNTYTYKYFTRVSNTEDFEEETAVENIVITEKTEINGNEYYNFEATTTSSESNGVVIPENGVVNTFVRDSIGYLVNLEGVILFSSMDTEPYIISENGWGNIFGELLPENNILETLLGAFEVVTNSRYAVLANGELSEGTDFVFRSEGTGLIAEYFGTVNDPVHRWEKRLIAFQEAE